MRCHLSPDLTVAAAEQDRHQPFVGCGFGKSAVASGMAQIHDCRDRNADLRSDLSRRLECHAHGGNAVSAVAVNRDEGTVAVRHRRRCHRFHVAALKLSRILQDSHHTM